MKNKDALWLMVFIVLAVYLVYADTVALTFYDGLQMNTTNFLDYVSTSDGRAHLDNYEKNENLFDEYSFTGWAFCNTTKPNERKEISVVLKKVDDSQCYSITQKPTNRYDVYEAYNDTYDIAGENHGFSVQFTTVPIEDGNYELYVYVCENTDSKCLIDMNMVFEKKGRYFGLYNENK